MSLSHNDLLQRNAALKIIASCALYVQCRPCSLCENCALCCSMFVAALAKFVFVPEHCKILFRNSVDGREDAPTAACPFCNSDIMH